MLYIVITIIVVLFSYIIYQKQNKKGRSNPTIPEFDHAIIIGGSLGGMVTAAYLSKYFKRITIIEYDDVLNDDLNKSTPDQLLDYRCNLANPALIGRSYVGQIYQIHVLQSEGANILYSLFPHIRDRFINEYNIRIYSANKEARLIMNGHLLDRNLIKDIEWLGIDRFTLETIVRRELCLQCGDKIQWKSNAKVVELIVDRSNNVVQGVKYRLKHDNNSQLVDIHGNFIVDCTGRNSSSTKWLKDSLNLTVPSTQIHFGGGYTSFVGERLKIGDPILDSRPLYFTNADVPHTNAGCYISPMCTIKTPDENSLGNLSIVGIYGISEDYPPNDSYESLLDWAKDHLTAETNLVLKATKVCGPLISFHRANNDRKYVEALGKTWPKNYVLVGDSMCSFNPQYGQGMTHAFRHARELSKVLNEYGHKLEDVSYIFNRRASKISEECWLAGTPSDWKTPKLKVVETDKNGNVQIYERGFGTTENPQPRTPLIIRFLQWYHRWFFYCASKSDQLYTDFCWVSNQQCNPFVLLKPTTIFLVCRAAIMHYLGLSNE